MTTTSRLSVNLSTIQPLNANGVFIPPRMDDIGVIYPGVTINLKGSTRMLLILYESPNSTEISKESRYIIEPDDALNIQFNLNARFFKLKLENLVNSNQSYLNLQTIYSQNRITEEKDSGSFKIWSNKTIPINTPSESYNSNFKNSLFTFYGNSSAITTITVQMSNDNLDWYNTQSTYTLTSIGNFGFSVSGCCKYIRLLSSAATTITTYINFK